MKIPALEHSTEKHGFGIGWILRRPTGVLSWMIAGFAIALALTVIVLRLFGTEEPGTVLALRMTARWSFLLFWLAYAGGAIARVFGRFQGLARHGRELGLAFAAAQLVHLGLIIWLYHIATRPSGAMIFFWVGMLCTYLLVLFSMPRARDALGLRLW